MEKTAKVSPGFSASLRSFSHLDVVLSVAFFDLTEEQVASIEEGKVICKSFLLKDVSNYI